MENQLKTLRTWLGDSHRITVLTGAGISTESGIPDFRSEKGVWQDEALLAAMTDHHLRNNPDDFWPKYKRTFLRPEYLRAQPNEGHRALARLEAQGKRVTIITQNVDGLHQLAGSTRVWEVHGSARSARCPRCGTEYGLSHILSEDVPRCTWEDVKGSVCGRVLHPDTVLFGQAVRHYGEALHAVQDCDLLLIIGTSLTVEPIASLPRFADRASTRIVLLNLDETDFDDRAHLVIHAKAGEVLRQAVPAGGAAPA
ncbi:NAD-dependent protein deacylase [Alicyclobacillus macrosporangiidus]|uniref:protein acetyllysine N-acetyltransferase n=1 Tax=Alicyclobacillus macrosporangiidus TaxID=392015 RepID=A0A1I7L4X0_9BACL|nr:NAD-dependent protein deacylase [Alicyclobacillus macrosporangiidus]SFV04767.1 NAD-dependent deacetylase [Alicyclobacillus macrosporangiidus]